MENPLIKALIILNQSIIKNFLKTFTRKIIKDLETTKNTIMFNKFLNNLNKTSIGYLCRKKGYI